MVEIRLDAKTFVIMDDGTWVQTWDEREPLTAVDLDKVAGGVGMAGESIQPPSIINPFIMN